MVDAVIEAQSLTKHYAGVVALDRLDLEVLRGEIFGYLGPNGAGKTTTIRMLLDLLRPTSGAVRVLGAPVGDAAVRRRIGYLPGDLVLDSRLTGRETLRFLGALQGQTSGAQGVASGTICDRLGLGQSDLDRPVRDYSKGMRQKLGLAAALQGDPELLILDEPTTGLDPLVREVVFDLLREARRAGRTVFLSSHVLSEVERVCDRAGILRTGRLMALARIDELRRACVRRMSVRFSRPVAAAELALPGVEVVENVGQDFVLRVSGGLDPLLAVLARHSVEHLSFPEPSLEEAFVSFYQPPAEGGR